MMKESTEHRVQAETPASTQTQNTRGRTVAAVYWTLLIICVLVILPCAKVYFVERLLWETEVSKYAVPAGSMRARSQYECGNVFFLKVVESGDYFGFTGEYDGDIEIKSYPVSPKAGWLMNYLHEPEQYGSQTFVDSFNATMRSLIERD